jgi:hypothetical protein
MSSSLKGKNWFCLTRAMKNVNHIKRIAPNTFPKGQAYTKTIPLEVLMKLHTLTKPHKQIKQKKLANALEKSKPPLGKVRRITKDGDAIGPGGTIVADPLFAGTLYFTQITFNNPGFVGTSLSTPDMQAAVSYSNMAVEPISLYASQYGPNRIDVSLSPLSFTANITGNTYFDSDLQGWVDTIVTGNGLGNACIVVLNDISIAINSDGDPGAGVGGYHGITAAGKNPYIFCNVFGLPTAQAPQNLTVDDNANLYAGVLSHEIAEATVDPAVDGQNPEVCDACAGNCGNIWNSFFDRHDQYIDALPMNFPGTGPSPPPFNYTYFINSVVRPDGLDPNSGCIYGNLDPRAPCAYPPVRPELPSV